MTGPFKELGRALVQNGYAIIPIPVGTKGPRFEGWQDTRVTNTAEYEKFIKGKRTAKRENGDEFTVPNVGKGDGIGILTKHTPAIDIDCFDEDIVESMIEWCKDNLGDAPERIGKAPKSLLLYATDAPFRKITSARYYDPKHPERDPKRNGQRLEVLGDGQQFVAYHTHPDTGKPYVWPNDAESPVDVSVFDLELITVEHAEAACREFERLCVEAGWEKLGEGSSSNNSVGEVDPGDALGELDPPDETEDEVARVKSALDAMKEVASEYDYDQWRNVLFSIKWTRWDCAEALAREWSESSDKHVTKEFNVVWRGAQKRERGREITLGTLFNMAKLAGWDASRAPSEEQQKATVAKLMTKIEEMEFESDTQKAALEIIKEMAEVKFSSTVEEELLKAIKKQTGYSVVAMRRDLGKARKEHVKEVAHMATHAGYAANLIEVLEEKAGVRPVGVEGMIYTYSDSKGIWKGTMTPEFAVQVSKLFDGQENCSRRNDYLAISQHAYSVLADGNEDFFSDGPVGLACTGRFYKVNNSGAIEREELDHTHRQRVLSPVKPVVGQMPLFEKYLEETFEGDDDTEQIELLQEVIGSIILGMTAKFEKVVLLKGPGRSGKGTIMKIIEAMLPREVRSAVSPFKWDSEYYLANLAGKRLNVVGELPDDEPIPAAQFKTVTGRDTLTGRHPSHRPFSFRNEAAHLFNTNHFVYTKDHTEAFYSRWILMEFRNSRIGRESEQVVDLAQRIIDEELPAIMAWALQGAKRLQDRGYFLPTKVQIRMLGQWRHRTNTMLEFLLDTEVCDLGDSRQHTTRRSELYKAYSEWCKASNRRPVGKMKLFDEIENNPIIRNYGVKKGADVGGNYVFRGIRLKADMWAHEPDDDEL